MEDWTTEVRAVFFLSVEKILIYLKLEDRNMKTYRTYDTNMDGDCNLDIDICGNNYRELLEICLKHSTYLSFRIWGNQAQKIFNNIPQELEKYRIPINEKVVSAYSHYYNSITEPATDELYCYKLCDETYKCILKISDSLFKWVNGFGYENPDDITFFRADFSIFLSSTVHEGYCTVYIRDNEDSEKLLNTGTWYEIT